ncbi:MULTISPECIES: universal stress protein [Flavobacterium]|jgi:nucleotide-binding universal stress UspA family protein|uniref:UspA domain protein n=1 Tax=Flavobacterium johnsoniae (strain ATCC 17061 / DSM 2064 / JCM 8514 / BCRC 14874 / CCUG 350202 / NBRC 14942 / NCIMB 11054 / UW101) TaxID=376686 RepID=A5FGE1_FLAJ1|nr:MULTISPECIES: universal stress protein [Flavobacterium]ABQ05730.1 UspA domain protein [Flavobacterium johnsoniae UW101]OXE95314.1 universal stress protein UspA [Flavobacterium johnsoniae UW101]WDF57550.1 universal stress protein [Flavobacterium sp. KACC 22758]WQG81467.1 universal stress protein [Flavobacterium johnsoniae UW101]SHM05130.1 Nucleotide-binding universal stress protein, UspA family [Flavobacterium johnsoniae]
MKKILFPTDFSEAATNAFVHALEFAKIVKAELVLLHTFEIPVYDSQFFPENYASIYSSIELAKFEMFKDEIPKLRAIAAERKLDDIVIKHRLMDGDLIYNLRNAVEEDQIDFVIMGTTGVSDWTKFFTGSNTNSVISEVKVPVLCVPVDAKFKKIKTIGFTTRYREKDKAELKKVLKIAKKTDAKVKSLYVKTSSTDVSDATIKEWEREFANDNVEFLVLPSDEVKETILDFILYKDIDILTTITHKRSFFEGIFDSSFSQKITKEVSIPVLIMHEN